MKIVYTIAGLYRPAGMERILTDKANYLACHGYEVLIVTTEQKGRPDIFQLDPCIRRKDLGIGYEDNNGASFFSKLLLYPTKRHRHRKLLTRLLDIERPDITISLFCGDERFLPDIKSAGKTILEVHFSRFKRQQYGRTGLWAVADKYRGIKDYQIVRKFDRFVALTCEDLGYWGNPCNGIVIPNFVELSPDVSPLTDKVVIGVGRLCYQKGFERLIAAWKIVAESPIAKDWRLVIIGDGEDKTRLNEQISELALNESVTIHEKCENMADVYKHASILALSSRYEGLPMVLLEAQSFGLPTVSFDCKCGPRDVITNGIDGLLVEEGNVEELANSLLRLLRDDSLLRKMGTAAKENSKRWDKDIIMRQWEILLKNI